MKVYLAQHCSYGRDTCSSKSEIERVKSRSHKNNCKLKFGEIKHIPESQPSSKATTVQTSVVNRSKSTRKQQIAPPITVKLYNKHTRAHTETQIAAKSEEIKFETSLNKTYSKKRLKTEVSNCNAETIRAIKKQTKVPEVQQNFIANIVKDRLNQQKKRTKQHENCSVKRIISLTQKAKESKFKNPEEREGEDSDISKRYCKSIETSFEHLYSEMQKEQLSERQEALCQLIRVIMKRTRHLQSSDEDQRLIRVVRELQQRNVRLMTLVNSMKRNGVDVDFFWNSSILS